MSLTHAPSQTEVPDVTVVLPCYNERDHIELEIKRIKLGTRPLKGVDGAWQCAVTRWSYSRPTSPTLSPSAGACTGTCSPSSATSPSERPPHGCSSSRGAGLAEA